MTIQDYELMLRLYEELEKECIRVAKIMKRVYNETGDDNYRGFTATEPTCIDETGVTCEYEDRYEDYYSCFIHKEWLLMPDGELNKLADLKIEENNQKKEEFRKVQKEKEHNRDIAEFYRLKEKLGFN